ncbi:MAG: radical SAM protein [Archangium sp.]|nr:radical SAM protein [Archangium sp.]
MNTAPLSRNGSFTLRVNVGEQCQYDCGYCRPGLVRAPTGAAKRVQPTEYARLARLFGSLGVKKVRFTGGEPLLRPDFREVVAAFHGALPGATLALTTNGQRLEALLDAPPPGLGAVTVHVDSLQPERYRRLMGEGDVRAVLASVVRARELGFATKLNVVVQRGLNDDELPDFLAWSRRADIEVRFIELMNTGSASEFTRAHFFSGAEVVSRLGATQLGRKSAADPACLFRAADGTVFGLIASDTAPFCADCARLRLSADGRLRGCLYEPEGAPLIGLLREGASDAMLGALMKRNVAAKQSHHPSLALPRGQFSMADLGG